MIEKVSGKTVLFPPLTEDDARQLKMGDIVYIKGIIHTCRDKGHPKIVQLVKEGKKLPIELEGAILFHAGPICKKEDDKWKLIVIGPTNSPRMSPFGPFICQQGVRAMMGMGGMDNRTLEALQKHGAVYLAVGGGLAVLSGLQVEKVIGVDWLDLGMPDAMWHLKVKEFGPVIVAMDSHGNSVYEKNFETALDKLPGLYGELGISKQFYGIGSLHGYERWDFEK
jgi:tartrate/fumarate subfamily iron-sulfur-dependent hydro-lyase beta chain